MPVSMTHDVKLLYFPFFSIGKDTLADIVKHFEENGARPRLRKKHSQPRPPAKFINPKGHSTEESTEEDANVIS